MDLVFVLKSEKLLFTCCRYMLHFPGSNGDYFVTFVRKEATNNLATSHIFEVGKFRRP